MKDTKFQTIPAIDLIDGKCVRLFQGDYSKVSNYNLDPVDQAKTFQSRGYDWLHIIDLDGAKAGSPVNQELIAQIARSTNMKVQVGGGIRTVENIQDYLEVGVSQIIVSSILFDSSFKWSEIDMSKITASLDFKDSKVCLKGWLESVDVGVSDLVDRLNKIGIERVIITDTQKDGTLTGPNIELVSTFKSIFQKETILAGGIGSMEDIELVMQAGIDGVVVGRMFYEP